LGEKTEYKKSRETVPLKNSLISSFYRAWKVLGSLLGEPNIV